MNMETQQYYEEKRKIIFFRKNIKVSNIMEFYNNHKKNTLFKNQRYLRSNKLYIKNKTSCFQYFPTVFIQFYYFFPLFILFLQCLNPFCHSLIMVS